MGSSSRDDAGYELISNFVEHIFLVRIVKIKVVMPISGAISHVHNREALLGIGVIKLEINPLQNRVCIGRACRESRPSYDSSIRS